MSHLDTVKRRAMRAYAVADETVAAPSVHMSARTAAAALQRISKQPLPHLLDKGVHFVRQVLEPLMGRLREAAANFPKSHTVLAQAHYVLGDIWESNLAFKTALKHYELATALRSDFAAAWREAGTLLTSLGRFRAARASISRAFAEDPADQATKSEMDYLEYASQHSDSVQRWASSSLHKAAELLAIRRPNAALKLLRGRRPTANIAMWRLCANAEIAGTSLDWLDELRRYLEGKGELALASPFWFYLPAGMNRSLVFWELLKNHIDQLVVDQIGIDQWLFKHVKLQRSRVYAVVALRMAQLGEDRSLTAYLLKKYPTWPALQQLRRQLFALR